MKRNINSYQTSGSISLPSLFCDKRRLARLLTVSLLSYPLLFSSVVKADSEIKDKNEKEVKFKVLQNREYNDCKYMDDVIIKVKYRMKLYERALLVAELSNDGVNYFDAAKLDIVRHGKSTIMEFNAGECAADLRVVIR